MRYTAFGTSREWSGSDAANVSYRIVCYEEVFSEARRRKTMLNLDQWQMEEYVSGDPMPKRVIVACEQIDLAANALARMSPIPEDFANDIYWPRMW